MTRPWVQGGNPDLSSVELEVLRDAADGLTVTETANRRYKGVETVKSHRAAIILKLNAKNITQAVFVACKQDLFV